MKAQIEMNGNDNKVVTFKEFEIIIHSISLGWYGIENWKSIDLDIFEHKFDGFTCEPFENGMKIWDRNFNYSNLY